MKGIYILLLVIVVASSISGCVENKQTGTSTTTQASPTQTSASPAVTVSTTPAPSSDDQFGTEADIALIDELSSDMNMDISLTDSI